MGPEQGYSDSVGDWDPSLPVPFTEGISLPGVSAQMDPAQGHPCNIVTQSPPAHQARKAP